MASSALVQFRDERLDKEFAQRVDATSLMVAVQEGKALDPEQKKEEERQRSRLFSRIAERDLDRYHDMLWRSLPKFSVGEAMLMCDALNGSINHAYSAPLLWAQISDSLEEGKAEKWEVDGESLVERLRKLTPFECMAVIDAIERAWSGPYHVNSLEEKVRVVGLVREEKKDGQ